MAAVATRKNHNDGFTLIELIVVMVLICTMTAFALPKLRSSLFSNQLRKTARTFIGFVAQVGQTARSKRTAVQVRYDRADHVLTTAPLTASHFGDTGAVNALEMKISDGVEIVDIISSHGGEKKHGDVALVFNARGYIDKTAVHLRDHAGNELSVLLSPFLGVTRVMEGYVTLEDEQFLVRQ